VRILTAPMEIALELARANGGYLEAGERWTRGGRVVRVNARTVDGLIDRGIAKRTFGSEGGVACLLISRVDS